MPRSRFWRHVSPWPSRDWVPINEAFARIRDVVGNSNFAIRDLWRLIEARSAARWTRRRVARDPWANRQKEIVVSDTGEARVMLTPAFWENLALGEDPIRRGRVVVTGKVGDKPLTGDWTFYVRRADLDERYPPAAAAPAETARSNEPPRRRSGEPTTHDWFAICAEIARRCGARAPTNPSKLAREVLEWCEQTYGRQPADSAMREAIRHFCALPGRVHR